MTSSNSFPFDNSVSALGFDDATICEHTLRQEENDWKIDQTMFALAHQETNQPNYPL